MREGSTSAARRGWQVLGGLGVVALSWLAATPATLTAQERTRVRPPDGFACDRNDLTVYQGVVTRYLRQPARTTLTIRTDADTTERVTVRHAAGTDAAAQFRYQGQPFGKDDWTRVEARPGVLHPGTRASAWVCKSGAVLVDWAPPTD